MQVNDALSKAIALPRPAIEVADIFRVYGEEYRHSHPLSQLQRRVMRDIEICRTASLGGHVDVCEHGCGYQRISYNSCRNRHCPKYQGLRSAQWLTKMRAKILPTHYFHMVFTVPQELHPIILQNHVFQYLGLYTHKVAISNHRLVQVSYDRVTFLASDNQNPGQKRSVTVSVHELIRRLLLHILPQRFMKTRHYGLMAPGNASTKLKIARMLIPSAQSSPSEFPPAHEDCSLETSKTQAWVQIFREITGIDLRICPQCGGVLARRPLTTLQQPRAPFEYGPLFSDSS